MFIEKTLISTASASIATQSMSSEYVALGVNTDGAIFALNASASTLVLVSGTVSSSVISQRTGFTATTESLSSSFYISSSYSVSASYVPFSPSAQTSSRVDQVTGNFTWAPTASYSPIALDDTNYTLKTDLVIGSKFTGSRNTGLLIGDTGSSYGMGNTLFKPGRVVRRGTTSYVNGVHTSDIGVNIYNNYLDYSWDSTVTSPPTSFLKVYESLYNLIVLGSDYKLYIAGDNTYGQLGDGTTTARYTLKQVNLVVNTMLFNNVKAEDFWATTSNTDNNSDLYVYVKAKNTQNADYTGNNKYYLVGWGGRNDQGMVGNNSTTNVTSPAIIITYPNTNTIPNPIHVFAGNNFRGSALQVEDFTGTTRNRASAWGNNDSGQTAIGGFYMTGSPGYITTPQPISADNNYGPYGGGFAYNFWNIYDGKFGRKQVGASNLAYSVWRGKFDFNTQYPQLNNQLYAAGNNSINQLGDNTTINRHGFTGIKTAAVTNPTGSPLYNITQYEAGPGGIIALDSTGSLWATGRNENGCWGNGDSAGIQTPFAKIIQTGISNFFLLDSVNGLSNLITVTTDQRNFIAGSNTAGECGVGTITDVTTRQQIEFPCGGYVIRAKQIGDYIIGSSVNYRGIMVQTSTSRVYISGHSYATAEGITGNLTSPYWTEVIAPD